MRPFFLHPRGGRETASGRLQRKDPYNREKGVRRLEKAYRNGRLSKENINRRGYNKFLEMKNKLEVAIDNEKIKEDTAWDGLKGYLTNTELPAEHLS